MDSSKLSKKDVLLTVNGKDPLDLGGVTVTAFIGAAGTGKSQRAQLVASKLDADYIIDDGLVIRRGQIVCGKSAKSEKNQVRAIRRALFEFDDHRQEVRNFLFQAQPCTVMVIATSKGMLQKIVKNLGLKDPAKIIRIEEVATPEEIHRAQLERSLKGQHVIPVSHVQIRKNFAGKLVGRLRVMWKPKNVYEGEKTIVRPPFSFLGDLHIEPEAISQIVTYVAKGTSQVASVLSVRVHPQGEDAISLDIDLKVVPGSRNFIQVARQVRHRVASSIPYFTGLEVRHVNVNVAEVGEK